MGGPPWQSEHDDAVVMDNVPLADAKSPRMD